MVVNQLLLQLDPPLRINPPVPYQGQNGSLDAQDNRDGHPKNPKPPIVIAGYSDVQRGDSYIIVVHSPGW